MILHTWLPPTTQLPSPGSLTPSTGKVNKHKGLAAAASHGGWGGGKEEGVPQEKPEAGGLGGSL
jgi:hypothetical protein